MTDPFHLDQDHLSSLASEPVIRRGIAYFREHRVTDLTWKAGEYVQASVEGSRRGLPYAVRLSVDEDGELSGACDCPYDWEPACKHIVATLLAYSARQPVTEAQVTDAAGEALEERLRRARAEVTVRHLSGDRTFGTWLARSLAPDSRGPYRVEIRSLVERVNHCECPDFAVNRLGTCKHIEAVLLHLRDKAPQRFERAARLGPSVPAVVLDWTGEDAPHIHLLRPARLSPELRPLLDRWFDAAGRFSGQVPAGWHRFRQSLRDGLLVGRDVEEYVARIGEEAVRRKAGAELSLRIRSRGGHIPGLNARLYPYQVDGAAFLAGNGRAVLADDMGLGKTLQAIAAAQVMMEEGIVARTLVVCPASLKHQWRREIERFTQHRAVVVQGGAVARRALYRERSPFTIVNYEQVLRDLAHIQESVAPDLLVLDEAQRIKNWRTKTAAAVKSIETTFAFVLTGTPLENRLEDLYSLMQVVDPRVLGPLWRFMLDFHVTDERGKVLGYRNLGELRRRLAPVMLRRDRRLVRDQLPDRVQVQLDVDLDDRQRALHDEAMQNAASIAAVLARRPLTSSEEHRLMAALQTARMACDAAGLVDKETQGSPKLRELEGLLEDLCLDGGHKVVVFSQWERMTAMAAELCEKLGLGVVRLHGGVPAPQRGALIDRFENDPGTRVFLSTDAGGVGLNLQAASALVNLDVPWNPAVLDQRIARVHRLGQKRTVHVVLMVAREAYEEQVAALVGGKRMLFDNVVDVDASEDVVGLSKRSLELALATLGIEADRPEQADQPVEPADPPAAATPASADREGGPEAESLGPVVEALQLAFGRRIERVVAAGGGLMVVVDAVEPPMEEALARVTSPVPLALVDERTYHSLARLGLAKDSPVFERPAAEPEPPALALARRKLEAAHALVDAACLVEAVEAALSAMLNGAAGLAAQPAPELAGAAVWIFGQLVPQGLVDAGEAAAVARALALRDAPSVPEPLARQVVADAAALVARLGGGVASC